MSEREGERERDTTRDDVKDVFLPGPGERDIVYNTSLVIHENERFICREIRVFQIFCLFFFYSCSRICFEFFFFFFLDSVSLALGILCLDSRVDRCQSDAVVD